MYNYFPLIYSSIFSFKALFMFLNTLQKLNDLKHIQKEKTGNKFRCTYSEKGTEVNNMCLKNQYSVLFVPNLRIG